MSYLDEHRNEIFKKYTDGEMVKDVKQYKQGDGELTKVLNHFFKELIFESCGPRGKKSPMEVLQNDDDMDFVLEYIKTKPRFYTGSEIQNVESFFRNGGRLAQKVANFCPKNARYIYFRYFAGRERENIYCIDTSCGFGARMSAVLLSGANYCGFDPNLKLVSKLKECAKFYFDNNLILPNQECQIYDCGSEIFKPELVDKFDVSFTSPPYFNIERYSNDNGASTKNYNNYELWLKEFVEPTIKNIYRYLKVGGYSMINIKNLTIGKREPLFDDWFRIFNHHGGFEFVEIFDMNHQSKKNYTMNCNYSKDKYQGFKEPIMVFKKIEMNTHKQNVTIDKNERLFTFDGKYNLWK